MTVAADFLQFAIVAAFDAKINLVMFFFLVTAMERGSGKCQGQVPANAKRLFSGANIEAFRRTINSDVLLELEILRQEGELDDAELLEYYVLLPEYQQKVREMQASIESFAAFMRKSIPSRLRSAFPEGETVYTRNLGELMVEVDNFCNSFYLEGRDTYFRDIFLGTFCSRLMQRVVIDICAEFIATDSRGRRIYQPPRYTDEKMSIFLAGANEHFARIFQVQTPAMRFLEQMPVVQKSINQLYAGNFRDLLQAAGPATLTAQQLQAAATEKFALIGELEALVGLDRADARIGGGRVTVVGMQDYLDPYVRAMTLYQFRVTLNPQLNGDYQIIKSDLPNGLKTTKYNVNNDYFEGLIDRGSGEIQMTAGLPYSLGMTTEQYLRLKNTIYDLILERLGEREAQILSEQQQARRAAEEMVEQRSAGVTEPAADLADSTAGAVTSLLPPGTFEARTPVAPRTAEAGDMDKAGDNDDLQYRRALRGLKGNVVIRVLKSMLDELPANGSSHRKFRCRDGSTYVIAVHGDRDVGIGLLLKCLRKFGVSAKEFSLKI